ncbi:MAG: hypothetical protein IMZ54_08415, partial [Acidobacteria bacterium]|nr:hypothetical protein [Acidobacteriota bacterium]
MNSKYIRILICIILSLTCGPSINEGLSLFGGQSLLPTPAEETNYRQYTQNEAIAAFLSRLDALSPELSVRVVGRTLSTDEYAARDIFLAILSVKPAASPEALDRAKPTVLF